MLIPVRGTILLVDDEESTGRLVRRHIPGWTVTQAFSLAAGRAQLGVMLDLGLVILDLNLGDTTYPEPLADNPFQGSFELARRIQRSHPSVPVVIFSSDSSAAVSAAARLAGADFLSKHDAAGNLALLRRRLADGAR